MLSDFIYEAGYAHLLRERKWHSDPGPLSCIPRCRYTSSLSFSPTDPGRARTYAPMDKLTNSTLARGLHPGLGWDTRMALDGEGHVVREYHGVVYSTILSPPIMWSVAFTSI